MKLLLHGINYAPELTGIGKYTGEMAEWLAARGHEVRVVTAPPYYPDWRVWPGFSAWRYRREASADGRLSVYRCPLWVPTRPGGLKRIVHLASFALTSLPVLLRQVFWRPDVVWVVEPALFCVPGAWLTARLSGARCWLHVQDFEVDAAFDLGLVRGARLRRMVMALEGWMLRRCDCVSTISGRMLERLRAKGVPADRTFSFPNWVDVSAIVAEPVAPDNPYRARLGIPAGAVVALYSGNMGAKQGLEILADAARLAPAIVFVLCGNGAARADLEARCAGLANVRFLDLQPVERLGTLLALADIHLLPQRADAADLVMPSKLTGMLASGRPVVATARPDTELAAMVAGHGVVVAPEDARLFAEAVTTLAADPALRATLGASARRHAEEHLDRDRVLARFEAGLIEEAACRS